MGSKTNIESKITVVLAEDHKILRQGIKTLIETEKDIQVTGEATNGVEAIELVRKLHPTLVLLDIGMPELNGIEASRLILSLYPTTKILILSAYSDDVYIEKAITSGVPGFLTKHCCPRLLIQAIREVANGGRFFSSMVLERIQPIEERTLIHTQHTRQKSRELSSREAQVLQLIAEGKANKQIAYNLNISIKTVEKHRQNLMRKLSIHDTAGLTRYAIAEGMIEVKSRLHFS